MKCKHCNAEWSVSAEISSQLVNCPFCGKPLVETKPELNTLEDVLREILRVAGEDDLRDTNRTVSYFADLAPQLTRERRMLRYFMDCGGGTIFLDSRTLPAADQQVKYQQVKRRMCDEWIVAEQAADQICSAFWTAVCSTPLPVDAPTAPMLRPVAEPVTVASKKAVYAQLVDTLLLHVSNLSPAPAPAEPDTIAADPDEAEKLYRQGLHYMYVNPIYGNHEPSEADKHTAFSLILKAAELGNIEAMESLARCYDSGRGVKKDPGQMIVWYRKAAELGNDKAAERLGYLYHWGLDVEQDYIQSLNWYRKAAELGNDTAMYELGECYRNGFGVEYDLVQAVEWYRKAAEHGNSLAMYELGECYANGRGVKGKDWGQAVEWFRKSAESGWCRAMYQLAWCYETGIGVSKDRAQAIEWYRKAAEKGDDRASEKLKKLEKPRGLFSFLKG